MSEELRLRVDRIIQEADGIRTFEFVDPQRGSLPPFTAGAHIDVHLPDGHLRQYSLCNDPSETHRYVVAVLRDANGRGGSAAMHDKVHESDAVVVSVPRNHFPLHEEAERHLLIAGGIGITPMLAMAQRLSAIGADYRLHYCARSPERTAFKTRLADEPFARHTSIHYDGGNPSDGLDLRALLAQPEPGTNVYCCGPTGLLRALKDATAHWPDGTVHFEFFANDHSATSTVGEGFEVVIASTGAVYPVHNHQSILQVLLEHGHDIDHSCDEGVCGTCIVGVLDGEPDHRDLVLEEAEKKANTLITVCCSRARSARLTLDL